MHDDQISIKVQFNQILFWGKPDELRVIIRHLQREATSLIATLNYEEELLFNLIMDLHTARCALALATGYSKPLLVHRDDARILFHNY